MLDAAAIIAEAEMAVGITDSDLGIRNNLAQLCAELNAGFQMTPMGLERTHQQFLADTIHRLNGLKFVAQHPEVADEPITDPVFLMGLPRSGTTYFQYLFDRDPRFRLIRTWESLTPFPPPHFDPASALMRKALWAEQRAKAHPPSKEFDALHLIDADGSDECHAFLEQSFGAAGLHNLFRVPDYFDFLLDTADFTETYRIHKRQLQLLQWRGERKPWALKYPNHVLAMPEILQLHPDARMAMTHRDPVQALTSICKMTHYLRNLRAAQPTDPHQVGRDMLHFIQRHIDRIMAFDLGPDGQRVIHVDYYAMVADPVREMRAIHRGLGIDTPDAVADAVSNWHMANPKNARGRNDYALAQFGLEDGAVTEQFSAYIARFSIPREHQGLARAGLSA